MPADEKESRLQPQRTAPVRQENLQPGEIDGHVIHVNRIAILVAGARENRGSGMKHDGHTVRLSCPVNNLKFLDTVQVIVGKKQLMRRMDFDHLQSKPQNLFDISQNVGGMAWMQAAA